MYKYKRINNNFFRLFRVVGFKFYIPKPLNLLDKTDRLNGILRVVIISKTKKEKEK